MKDKNPIQLKELPEPLRTFAYNFFACSHHTEKLIGALPDDNPMIYPDFLFDSWEELNKQLKEFLLEVEKI